MLEDLHKQKASHLSLPVTHDLEFHLREDDMNRKCEVGKYYLLTVPCICTSEDDGTARFKQTGVLEIVDDKHAGKAADSLFNRIKKAKY